MRLFFTPYFLRAGCGFCRSRPEEARVYVLLFIASHTSCLELSRIEVLVGKACFLWSVLCVICSASYFCNLLASTRMCA